MQVVTPQAPRGRVGFVIPRWTVDPVVEGQGIPFRAVPVASALFNAGWEVVWFDQEQDLDRTDRSEDFRRALAGSRAVFLWTNELTPAVQTRNFLAIASRIRQWEPSLTVAVGGSFVSLCPAEVLFGTGLPVDYFLRDHGEETAPRFLEALEERAGWESVSGLVDPKEGRANPLGNGGRFLPEHTTLYRLLDLSDYRQSNGGIFGNGQPTFVVGTGRGCAKGCAFCYWTNFPPTLLPASTIVDLVSFLRGRYGVRQFHLAELDAFASRRRPLDLAALWRERNPDAVWFTLASPIDALRYGEKEWDLLAEGGCAKIEFGTESGSVKVLRAIGKRHAPEDPLRLTRTLLVRGICSMHNFVFGTVGETEEDRRRSLRLILRLHDLDPLRVFFTFRIFQAAWGVPMGEAAIAHLHRFPRSLQELLADRATYGDPGARALEWLPARDERRIKRMTTYDLPMFSSRMRRRTAPGRALHGLLRRVARARVRTGFTGLGVDRWVYRRLLRRGLDNTYTE